ncbi:hypothetical protein WJX73_007696 [Symbiochloris irregularis]|uniref:Uncharacterized protein n=1 Tax=Symbiochloris irregularis TaxID=706552 RepID=A0AAW1P0Q6_9CHLO
MQGTPFYSREPRYADITDAHEYAKLLKDEGQLTGAALRSVNSAADEWLGYELPVQPRCQHQTEWWHLLLMLLAGSFICLKGSPWGGLKYICAGASMLVVFVAPIVDRQLLEPQLTAYFRRKVKWCRDERNAACMRSVRDTILPKLGSSHAFGGPGFYGVASIFFVLTALLKVFWSSHGLPEDSEVYFLYLGNFMYTWEIFDVVAPVTR